MAKALHPHVRVRVLVTPGSHEQLRFEAALAREGGTFGRCRKTSHFAGAPLRHLGARRRADLAPPPRERRARKMVKPTYTLWGYLVGGPRGRGHVDGPWASCDVPNTVPDQLAPLLGVPVEDAAPFKTEGGDKSFNGRGTVLMSLAVERQRHPGLSVAGIEKLARTHLKAAHVVWIDQGVQDDEQSFRGPARRRQRRAAAVHGDRVAVMWTRRRASSGRGRWCVRAADGGAGGGVARRRGDGGADGREREAARGPDRRGGPPAARRADALPRGAHARGESERRGLHVGIDAAARGTVLVCAITSCVTICHCGLVFDADAEIEIVLAASYTNYVVANGVVLVPQYDHWRARRRREALVRGAPKRFAEADQRARAAGRSRRAASPAAQDRRHQCRARQRRRRREVLNCISNNMPA